MASDTATAVVGWIELLADGSWRLALPSPNDAPAKQYTMRPLLSRLSAWAVVIEGEDGAAYRVSVDAVGNWRCSCDSWKYRGPCKHTRAAEVLKSFLDHMRIQA